MSKANLISPYGGKLVNLVVEGKEREELLARASKLTSIKITMRNLCDLELLATGGFSPLKTFMGKADYERVLHEMRLCRRHVVAAPHHADGGSERTANSR